MLGEALKRAMHPGNALALPMLGRESLRLGGVPRSEGTPVGSLCSGGTWSAHIGQKEQSSTDCSQSFSLKYFKLS
jgi:hypothetical protein